MDRKEAYAKRVQAQLDEWDADIQKLKAKADKASAEAEIEYQKQIDNLMHQREKAKNRLSELKSAGSDAWEDLKEGVESATRALGEAISSSASRLK